MPYIRKTTKVNDRIYRTHVYSGRYGNKSIPAPKKNKTAERVKEWQKKERIKKLAWLIELNFVPGDLSVTLTFRKENRPEPEKVAGIKKELLKELRKHYAKQSKEFKYIIVTEKKKTCIHMHLVINDVPGISQQLSRLWNKKGRVYISPLYESRNKFQQLASYLVKEKSKDQKEPGELAYSRSRNLKLPETKTEVMKAFRWKEEPKPPKGYYLDKESLVNGIDHNGFPYQSYVFIKYPEEKKRRCKRE